jgi:hypothetical protein
MVFAYIGIISVVFGPAADGHELHTRLRPQHLPVQALLSAGLLQHQPSQLQDIRSIATVS